jgi:hypothetical protein
MGSLAHAPPFFDRNGRTIVTVHSELATRDGMPDVIISNLELIPGKRVVEHLGIVQGSTVRAKQAGRTCSPA